MRTTLSFVVVLTIAVAGLALAQNGGPEALPARTAVVMVGEITSQPKDFGFAVENKMQVAVGLAKLGYTVHLGDAPMFDTTTGKQIPKSSLRDKWWVRVEGTVMTNARRILASKVEVLAKNEDAFRKTAYWTSDRERGYIETVAGMRQVYP